MSNPTSFILFLIACFLSVICQGLPRSRQTNDIFGVEYFDDSDDAYFRSENNIGFPPPSYGGDLGVSCDCKQILVSSLGEAQHIQPDSMGVYKYYTSFNGRPAYHKSNGRRLYFLAGSGWLIGTQVGAQTGFVHHASHCPYLIADVGWMYVNQGYWYKDNTLVVRCIQ